MTELLYPEVIMSAYYQDDPEVKKYYKLQPLKDITAWESAKLVELYAYVVATKKQCDWQAFVNNNKLQRHFTEVHIEDEE